MAPVGGELTSYEKVRQILIDEMSVEPDRITPEVSLAKLELDSLETVFLITALEDAFGVDVLEDDFHQLRTVQDVADYAEKRLACA